jgi:hypothetical protein
VLSSKLSPQSVMEEPGDGELTVHVWGTLHQTGDDYLVDIPCLPDPSNSIIGQPDLKYNKIERTGSDKQKRSPSNILPSRLINQKQLPVALMKVSGVFLTTLV